jgi:hypothetical protein
MDQLAITTSQSGRSVNLRCPYQANVMNAFDMIKSTMGISLTAAVMIVSLRDG